METLDTVARIIGYCAIVGGIFWFINQQMHERRVNEREAADDKRLEIIRKRDPAELDRELESRREARLRRSKIEEEIERLTAELRNLS